MKKTLLALALLAGISGITVKTQAQQPYQFGPLIVSCTNGVCTPSNYTTAFNVPNGIGWFNISWTTNGVISTCSTTLDSAPDGVTFTVGGLIPAFTCTSSGSVIMSAANYVNFGRLTPTQTGAGTVVFTITGYNNGNSPGTATTRNVPGVDDPCGNPNVMKTSKALNVTASAIVVALSGNTTIYVCSIYLNINGGTGPFTVNIQSGTGAVCGTSTANLTGIMSFPASATSTYQMGPGGSSLYNSGAARQICILVGGTTPSYQGHMSYVQQ